MTATTTTLAAAKLGDALEDRATSGSSEPDAPGDEPPEPAPKPAAVPSASAAIHLHASPAVLDDAQQQRLRDRVTSLLPHLQRPVVRVAVMVVGDTRMRALHHRHLDQDSTTDVLTFQQSTPDAPILAPILPPIDVDIAVCIDEARRRAAAVGRDPLDELLLYIVHGLLHCAGFDDHDDASAAAMHAEEDRLLQAIGVGAVYRAPEPGR